ncbi:MAG: MlaD family protein [Acidobacteria bacterium]|nr:MlaD family protein [Acidobacteriota bacterium]
MPQNKPKSFSEMRVGILVLSSLAILIFVIFAVSGDIRVPGFTKTTIIKTDMASVDGLRKGAEVRLSGKQVGSVKEIVFTKDIPSDPSSQNNLEIVMEINGKLDGRPAVERIRTDSMAVLKSAGVLGENVIDITPGTLSRGRPINNGDRIKSLEQKSVGDIINAAQTAVGNLNVISDDIKAMTGNLRKGGGSMGKFLNDESFYVDLDKTVRQAENLMKDIREGEGTIGKLVKDPALYDRTSEAISQLRGISDQLNDQITTGKGTLGKLVKDEELYNRANSLVDSLDKTSAKLERTMAKIERGEGNLGRLINDEKLYTDAKETVDKLRVIADRLERGEGSAGLLLKDERLYNNLNNMSAEITKMLYDFRQNPRRYLSVKVALF